MLDYKNTNIAEFQKFITSQKMQYFLGISSFLANNLLDFDWKNLRKLLDTIINDKAENLTIRKQALTLLCNLTFVGKISPIICLGTLLNIEEDDDQFLIVDQVRYLFYFYDQAPIEIHELLISSLKHESAEVTSEAFLRLGQIKLFEANKSEGLDHFLALLKEANILFEKAGWELENRIDAEFYINLCQYLVSCIINETQKKEELFIKLSNILWTYSVFSLKNKPDDFHLKLYEVVAYIYNITSNPIDWLELRKSLSRLYFQNFNLINLQIEDQIFQSHLIKLFKKKNLEVIVEPFYRLSFKAQEAAINNRIEEVTSNTDELNFLLYLKDLVLSQSIKKKELPAELIARLSRLFPNIQIETIVQDVKTFEAQGLDEVYFIFKLFEKYKNEPRLNIVNGILIAASELQGNHKTIKSNEDSRNNYIASILKATGFTVKDQSKWGASATGKTPGELDVKLEDKQGLMVALIEGLNLKSLDTTVIESHLIKVFNYDPNAGEQNFIIVYAEAKDFIGLWEKYLSYVPKINFIHPLIGGFKDISHTLSVGSSIKVGLALHQRNKGITNIYHIFVNMLFD